MQYSSLSTRSDPSDCFQTEELVKALQDLENAASGDAAVRQKIASLPQEVQDVSLLEKITGESRSKGNVYVSMSVSVCRMRSLHFVRGFGIYKYSFWQLFLVGNSFF